MILLRYCLFTAAITLGISSCTPQAHEAERQKATAVVRKPKPVLMNGRGKVTSISLTELFTLQQSGKVLIYDARPGFFYALGHLPGAISLPKEEGDDGILKHEAEIKAAIAAKKPVVVYCTNLLCPDARTVANHLAGFGYSSSVLTGGWDSWKEADLPTE